MCYVAPTTKKRTNKIIPQKIVNLWPVSPPSRTRYHRTQKRKFRSKTRQDQDRYKHQDRERDKTYLSSADFYSPLRIIKTLVSSEIQLVFFLLLFVNRTRRPRARQQAKQPITT